MFENQQVSTHLEFS